MSSHIILLLLFFSMSLIPLLSAIISRNIFHQLYFNCSYVLLLTSSFLLFLSLLFHFPSRLSHCRAELQASDSRYQAQRRITQLLQTELLQLYSRVEMEAPSSTATGSPQGGRADPHKRADSRSNFMPLLLFLVYLT